MNPLTIDPLLLRRLIAWTLFSVPLQLGLVGYLTSGQLQPSLSAYAHTPLAPWFTGLLFAVAAFLTTYKGYDVLDRRTSAAAAAAATAVAVFPVDQGSVTLFGVIHGAAALVLFAALARFSWRLFSSRGTKVASMQKLRRNKAYRACGALIALAVAGVAVCGIGGYGEQYRAIFWLESLGLWAAAASWYIKGEGVKALNDK